MVGAEAREKGIKSIKPSKQATSVQETYSPGEKSMEIVGIYKM